MAEARIRIALLGAGSIGRQHAARIQASPEAVLAGVVDPADAAAAWAAGFGAPRWPDLAAMLRECRPAPGAAVVASPNAMHAGHGLDVIAAGVPVLVEKPLADTLEGGERLVEAAERAGVALLVGHDPRHNPRVGAARQAIAQGRIHRGVGSARAARTRPILMRWRPAT